MAVSSAMRRAYSLALCRVGECAPPLRAGSVRTQGIEIVVGDDATLAKESSFTCSVISMRSRCTTALSRGFSMSFRSSHEGVLKREDATEIQLGSTLKRTTISISAASRDPRICNTETLDRADRSAQS